MSDIYNPSTVPPYYLGLSMINFTEVIMLSGMYLVGFLSLGIGFARDDIVILVLRALSGIGQHLHLMGLHPQLVDLLMRAGAALTIPSSLHMLIHTFPDPIVQAKAVSAFAGSAVVANRGSLLAHSSLS